MKHTPVPWTTYEDKHGIHISNTELKKPVVYRIDSGSGFSMNEYRANARFIVTACNSHDDLLDALQRALMIMDGRLNDVDFAIEKARAAIAKAQG